MKIEKLIIKNYKGFENCELNLKPDINVFVGVNGAGKTSIIELAATFLNQFVDKLCGKSQNQFSEFSLSTLDININSDETKNTVFLKAPRTTNVRSFTGDFESLQWNLNKSLHGGKINLAKLNDYIKRYQNFLSERPDACIPIFRHYPCHRLMDEKASGKAITKRYLIPQFKAYEKAFSKTMAFDTFIEWFVEEENKENREKIKREDLSYSIPSLNFIREALKKAFSSFSETAYTRLRVETREINLKTNEKSSLVIDKNNATYNLKQLSEGEKIIILMIADIAYLLSVANPSTNDPLSGSGIILIDEIDLHLHPAWQREIIPCLRGTFPNLQFLVTTHSPQVLSRVDSENVFLIEDFNVVSNMPKTMGKDSNSILWDVFAVKDRPESARKDFEALYQLIEKHESADEVKKLLNDLEEKYGGDDSELLKAKLQFDFQLLEDKQ